MLIFYREHGREIALCYEPSAFMSALFIVTFAPDEEKHSHWGMMELSKLNLLMQHIYNIACVCQPFKSMEGRERMSQEEVEVMW